MNTMEDLKKIVSKRLVEAVDGEELPDYKKIRTPHLLGAVGLYEEYSISDIDGTILDTQNEFWDEWHTDMITQRYVRDMVERAIGALEEEGYFTVEIDGDVAYVEADEY